MSHVEIVDALSEVKFLQIAEGGVKKIKYGSLKPDEFIKAEHVVQGKKHIFRAYGDGGKRLVAVITFGDGQSMYSNREKALEAFRKRLSDHLHMLANNRGIQTNGLY